MTAPQDPRLARNPLSRSPRKNTEASSASRPARFRRVRGVLLFAAVLLASLPAMAAPTDAEKETARSLMADGDRLRDSQDYQSALQRYQAAHQIMNVPTTGIEVAKTFALLGKLVEARRAAIEVANLPVTPGEPSVMAEARQEANTLAANLATRIPGAVIQVWPREANARVLVDGVEIPPAAQGLPYKTNPGDHVVQVSAPGYQTAEQSFRLEEGAETTVSVNLVADPSAAAVAPAPAPPAVAPPPPEPAAPAATPVEAAERDGRDLTNAYVAFSIAGAGVLVGSITGVLSLSHASAAKDHCEGDVCSAAAKDDIDSAKALATFSNIGFGVALAAGAWGLYEVLSQPAVPSGAPAARKHSSPPVALMLAPGQLGAAVQGAF